MPGKRKYFECVACTSTERLTSCACGRIYCDKCLDMKTDFNFMTQRRSHKPPPGIRFCIDGEDGRVVGCPSCEDDHVYVCVECAYSFHDCDQVGAEGTFCECNAYICAICAIATKKCRDCLPKKAKPVVPKKAPKKGRAVNLE